MFLLREECKNNVLTLLWLRHTLTNIGSRQTKMFSLWCQYNPRRLQASIEVRFTSFHSGEFTTVTEKNSIGLKSGKSHLCTVIIMQTHLQCKLRMIRISRSDQITKLRLVKASKIKVIASRLQRQGYSNIIYSITI